jgi:hypothetical protein
VVDYEVYDQRPNDSDVLIPAIQAHQNALGRTPHLVAADAAFYSAKNGLRLLVTSLSFKIQGAQPVDRSVA